MLSEVTGHLYDPYPVILFSEFRQGFTFGIAVTIVIGQVKDFLGLTFTYSPVETIDKVKECVTCIAANQHEQDTGRIRV